MGRRTVRNLKHCQKSRLVM